MWLVELGQCGLINKIRSVSEIRSSEYVEKVSKARALDGSVRRRQEGVRDDRKRLSEPSVLIVARSMLARGPPPKMP